MSIVGALVPYVSAVALMFGGLYIERKQMLALIPPIWILLVLSLWNIRHLPTFFGLSNQFGMLAIITFLHCPTMLASTTKPLDALLPDCNLVAAYELFNNPRALDEVSAKSQHATSKERFKFAASSVMKGLITFGVRSLITQLIGFLLLDVKVRDFGPGKEDLISMVISRSLTRHELVVRACIALSWIRETYAQLTIVHLMLGTMFVSILRVDDQAEWPPLFASPSEAYTFRGFRGTFWHRLITPSAKRWARFMTDPVAIIKGQERLSKTFVAFFIFSLSGLARVLVGWRLGETALWRDLYFFWANFAAVGAEITFTTQLKGKKSPKPHNRERMTWPYVASGVGRRVLGFMWVLAFFVALTPYVVYPRIYHEIRSQMGILGLFA